MIVRLAPVSDKLSIVKVKNYRMLTNHQRMRALKQRVLSNLTADMMTGQVSIGKSHS